MTRLFTASVLLLALAVPVWAQGPAQPVAAAPAAQAPASAQAPAAARGFDYDGRGRRDPFVSLLGRGTTPSPSTGARQPGLAGLETAEVALTGTLQTPDGSVAMLRASDGRTYVVRPGDKLRDGAVRAITQNALVIVQQVNDPLAPVREREVRKTIRQIEAN